MAKSPLMSHAGTTRAMIVDLSRGFAAEAPRVLPLGDSNTLGASDILPEDRWESYRAELWSRVTAGGDWINYVGAYSNGPENQQDTNHHGVGGIHATTVAVQAEGLGRTYEPDVVLMMLGTNDVLTEADGAITAPAELLAIMRSIERSAPDTAFLVAPLPPIDVSDPSYPGWLRRDAEASRDALNAQLPGIVEQARAEGLDADFVAMPSLGKADLYDGIHLTRAGHAEIAEALYEAIEAGLDEGAYDGARASTRGVRDIAGSERGDLLRGDDAANAIWGRRGADRIEGMGGSDILTGGKGADIFVFASPRHGGDTIGDFGAADHIEIDASRFKGGLEVGDTAILRSAEDPLPRGSAGQFLYDRDDGRLYWDADGTGNGNSTLIATLFNAPLLDPDDFMFS